MKRIGILLLLTGLFINGSAQTGLESNTKYGKGEDSIRCMKNLSLYRTYYKQKDYASAVVYWKVPFAECPTSSKNVYIHGAKMYNKFLKEEKNPTRFDELLDTLMLIYDNRIKYFDERGKVLGRQGVDLLRYKREEIEYVEKGYKMLKESIELQNQRASDPAIATFMTAAVTLYTNNALDDNTLIDDYLNCSAIIDAKLAKRDKQSTRKIKESMDQNVIATGVLSCEKIVEIYQPKYEANKEDAKLLEDITGYLKALDCTDEELFYNASRSLYPIKPSVNAALNLAQIAIAKGENEEAIKYFEEAITLETEEAKKADYFYGIAVAQSKLNKQELSRQNARKAIALRSDWGEPYILIGKLYAGSLDQCSESCIPSSVYWVAVDKFMKAKTVDPSVAEEANKLILTYTKYFPNIEKAFFCTVNEGDDYKVGCWINESTKARFNQ
jgi:tetratricopeptide (TPR) repeat protein